MKRLPRVRSGLARLRLYRSTVRLAVCGSMAITVVLWALLGLFAVDFLIGMDHLERGIMLAVLIGAAMWLAVRYLLPALNIHESDTALAVMVDDKHHLHSDFVAAIQFDDERRPQYGSAQLRDSVVERTARTSSGLNFLAGFSRKEMTGRLVLFAATAALCSALAVLYADHTRAFFGRLTLTDAEYPTRTRIEEILSPGKYATEGLAVTFTVRASGELPESGRVYVETAGGGPETTVKLAQDRNRPDIYSGTLSRVVNNLSYTVHLGDATKGPLDLAMVPMPRAELDMKVIPPPYTGKAPSDGSGNRRQVVVLEGSQVIPVVTSNTYIVSSTLTILKDEDKTVCNLVRRGNTFVPPKANPLERVTEMVRFEVQVTDSAGLSLEKPIQGLVQVTADRPPQAAVAAYSRLVVPDATPVLRYVAIDDYELETVTLEVAVIDNDGRQRPIVPAPMTVRPDGREVDNTYALALAGMKLEKGN